MPVRRDWGGAAHDIGYRALEAETHVGQTRGDHDDPNNLDGGEGENGEGRGVLEGEADEQGAGLGDVLGEHV